MKQEVIHNKTTGSKDSRNRSISIQIIKIFSVVNIPAKFPTRNGWYHQIIITYGKIYKGIIYKSVGSKRRDTMQNLGATNKKEPLHTLCLKSSEGGELSELSEPRDVESLSGDVANPE